MSEERTKYCHGCQAQLDVDESECPYCHQKQQSYVEERLARGIRSIFPHHMPASRILLVSIIVYFIIVSIDVLLHPKYGLKEVLLSPPPEIIYRWGAHSRGETVWWRLITANFVHFGIIHIIFNAYALRYVSPYVERAYGSAMTIASFLVLGTGSMLCSNLLGDSGLVAGASGGLMAFIGMAAVSSHLENTALSLQVRNSMIKWALFTFVFGFAVSFGGMGIDNIAHISGFVLGGLAGFVLPRQSTTGFTRLWMIRLSRIALILTVGIASVAFASMANTSAFDKYQRECIASLKIRQYDKADVACSRAYETDKGQEISYHNYIYTKIMLNDHKKARELCAEGRSRFEKPSFDGLCKIVGQ